jgi:hypothetical protein
MKKKSPPLALVELQPPATRATVTDIRKFHRSVNWAEWWEEYYTKIDKSGRPFYKSIDQFAASKAGNAKQREFIVWYLGPDNNDEAEEKKYFGLKPQDWKKKRDTGGWFTESNLRALSKTIRSQMGALEALRQSGNDVTLNFVQRIGKLAEKVDEAFRGEFFVDDLSLTDNMRRAEAYLNFHKQLLGMLGQAQDLYAKSHGINFSDMQGFASLIAASAAAAAQRHDGGHVSRENRVIQQLTQMMLVKAAERKLPLPDEMHDKIVDVMAEEDDPADIKKQLN